MQENLQSIIEILVIVVLAILGYRRGKNGIIRRIEETSMQNLAVNEEAVKTKIREYVKREVNSRIGDNELLDPICLACEEKSDENCEKCDWKMWKNFTNEKNSQK